MIRRRPQGTTLIEMLIYSATLSIFMLGVFSAFIVGRQNFFIAQAQSDALQATQAAHGLIRLYVSTGAQTTLAAQASPPAFMFLSARGNDLTFEPDVSTGKLIWKRWVCFYLDTANNRLKMSEQFITPTTSIPASPTFATMLGLPSRTVARDVSSLSFLPSSASPTSYLLVTSATPSIANGKATGLVSGGSLTMRNSGN